MTIFETILCIFLFIAVLYCLIRVVIILPLHTAVFGSGESNSKDLKPIKESTPFVPKEGDMRIVVPDSDTTYRVINLRTIYEDVIKIELLIKGEWKVIYSAPTKSNDTE